MAQFKVDHDYRSNHNGHHYAYDEGATVDVDDETAEWVNRDSPGTLVPVKSTGKKAAKKSTAKKAAKADPEPKSEGGADDGGDG